MVADRRRRPETTRKGSQGPRVFARNGALPILLPPPPRPGISALHTLLEFFFLCSKRFQILLRLFGVHFLLLLLLVLFLIPLSWEEEEYATSVPAGFSAGFPAPGCWKGQTERVFVGLNTLFQFFCME